MKPSSLGRDISAEQLHMDMNRNLFGDELSEANVLNEAQGDLMKVRTLSPKLQRRSPSTIKKSL